MTDINKILERDGKRLYDDLERVLDSTHELFEPLKQAHAEQLEVSQRLRESGQEACSCLENAYLDLTSAVSALNDLVTTYRHRLKGVTGAIFDHDRSHELQDRIGEVFQAVQEGRLEVPDFSEVLGKKDEEKVQ